MTHADVAPAEQREAGISPSLIRLSVGVEAACDLIADLGAALREVRTAGPRRARRAATSSQRGTARSARIGRR
jgi:cystathionine gamma-synthase